MRLHFMLSKKMNKKVENDLKPNKTRSENSQKMDTISENRPKMDTMDTKTHRKPKQVKDIRPIYEGKKRNKTASCSKTAKESSNSFKFKNTKKTRRYEI